MRDQAALFIPARINPAADDHGSTSPVGVARAYAAYRPSGLAWLGDLPAHWRTKPLRFACRLNPTKGEVSHLPGDTEVSFVPMEAVGGFGGMDLSQIKPIEDVLQGYTYFRDGDIVAAKITPCFENGKGSIAEGLTNGLGFGTTELHTLRPGPEFDTRFLFYLTLSHEFRHQGAGHMYGAGGQKRVPEDFLRNFVAPLPPVPEQSAIAAWLDDRARRIDELVAAKQRLVGLLVEQRTTLITHAVTKGLEPAAPMKPSGIDWLGELPRHWEVKRIKFIARVGNGSTPSRENAEYWGGEYPWLNSGVVNLREVTEASDFVTDLALAECHLPIVHPPAVLVGITGEGKTRGMATVLRIEATINQHLAFVRPTRVDCHAEYIRYCLHAAYQFLRDESGGGGSTKGALTCDQLGNVSVPLPPHPEQLAIVAHLDAASAKLGALIVATETAISRLTEYRQALISAAVTGKINVCGAISAVAIEESPAAIITEAAAAPVIAGRIGCKVRKANKFFYRDVLAAEIIARIGQQPKFGWVKLQKSLILAEGHLRLGEIESEPVRAAAGPFDNKMMRSIQAQLKRAQWYEYKKDGQPFKYAALTKAGGHKVYFDRYWSAKEAAFAALMALLAPMTTRQAEILATLYSAWNDFLLDGRAVTDDALVAEVLTNWDPAKQAIPEQNWRAAPPWMRKHGLMPTGYGAHTRPGAAGRGSL